jgi:UDP-N-acetylmuramoyl-tripeptide--D-alanyl-D-alanine ligase
MREAARQGTFQHFNTKTEAAEWLRQNPVQGRQVLIKGSRGMALETLVELL